MTEEPGTPEVKMLNRMYTYKIMRKLLTRDLPSSSLTSQVFPEIPDH